MKIDPWYKQFWPWFIFSLPASAVLAGIFTIVIAIQKSDSLVDDNYYRQGMAINRDLHSQKLAGELGLSASFSTHSERKILFVNLAARSDWVSPPMLLLRLSHPFDSEQDMELPLIRSKKKNQYQQEYLSMAYANWHAELSPVYVDAQQSQQTLWSIKTRFLHSGE